MLLRFGKKFGGLRKSDRYSASLGPAMRAAIVGAAIDDDALMLKMVRASSRLTHCDPKAEYGAIAVALAAKQSRLQETVEANLWIDQVVDAVGEDGTELIGLIRNLLFLIIVLFHGFRRLVPPY